MTFEISPSVVSRQVGDETMLMDLKSGTYFGLDPIGARVWETIENGRDIEALCLGLVEEFDVSFEQLHGDVSALVDELREQELILPVTK